MMSGISGKVAPDGTWFVKRWNERSYDTTDLFELENRWFVRNFYCYNGRRQNYVTPTMLYHMLFCHTSERVFFYHALWPSIMISFGEIMCFSILPMITNCDVEEAAESNCVVSWDLKKISSEVTIAIGYRCYRICRFSKYSIGMYLIRVDIQILRSACIWSK